MTGPPLLLLRLFRLLLLVAVPVEAEDMALTKALVLLRIDLPRQRLLRLQPRLPPL